VTRFLANALPPFQNENIRRPVDLASRDRSKDLIRALISHTSIVYAWGDDGKGAFGDMF
jgi:hypothetical protein